MGSQTSEERLQILKMLQEGRITVEQAHQLLGALEEPPVTSESSPARDRSQFFRILVQEGNTTKVNVNIPLGLVRALAHLIPKDALKVSKRDDAPAIDLDAIIRAVEEGASGKIIEVDDDETRVEIFVD